MVEISFLSEIFPVKIFCGFMKKKKQPFFSPLEDTEKFLRLKCSNGQESAPQNRSITSSFDFLKEYIFCLL